VTNIIVGGVEARVEVASHRFIEAREASRNAARRITLATLDKFAERRGESEVLAGTEVLLGQTSGFRVGGYRGAAIA
jgi:hypothetical protein